MLIKNLVIITSGYPTDTLPASGTFVRELVMAYARLGVNCTVIRPVSIWEGLNTKQPKFYQVEQEENAAPVVVLSPRHITFSNKNILGFRTRKLTQFSFESTVQKAYRHVHPPPDAFYGHFLYPSGGAAAKLGRIHNIPAFAAVGESSLWTVEPLGINRARRDFTGLVGAIAVSTVLKRIISSKIGIQERKIGVFPNGANLKKFFPALKIDMRKKLNFPQDMFIVAFVGSFSDRKGVMRVVQALKDVINIGMVLIGSGQHNPVASNILFKGLIPHELVPEYLSTADVFVLPSDAEGSCNAIVEAMACGLPIITSRGEFNDDIVDDTNAIRIDPQDIHAIRNAVLSLKQDDSLREKLSQGSKRKVIELDIDQRAQRILNWMNTRIQST